MPASPYRRLESGAIGSLAAGYDYRREGLLVSPYARLDYGRRLVAEYRCNACHDVADETLTTFHDVPRVATRLSSRASWSSNPFRSC